MGRRRKNTFAKALGQLKSTKIDEKIQMLSERPTNSVMTYMTTTPSTLNPDFISSQRGQDSALSVVEPDFAQDDASENGRDTTGLFQEDGTPRTAMPPGDTSYILGPMAGMFYNYSSPWTRIGYIRQSDRKMVNLGSITGKLSDWDGSSNFTSYGQLTLAQAQWFKDVQKAPGQTNDPDSYNYRAFYPGPPSSSRDAFGRYYCVVTGQPLSDPLDGVGEKEQIPGEGGEPTPDDIFSAILDRLRKGEKLSKAEKDWLKGKLPDPRSIRGNRLSKEAWAMDPDKFREKYGMDPEDVRDYYSRFPYGDPSAASQSQSQSNDPNVNKAIGHGLSADRANEMSPAELDRFNQLQDNLQSDIDRYSAEEQAARKEMRDIAIGFGIDVALTIFGGAILKGGFKALSLAGKAIKGKNIAKASQAAVKASKAAQQAQINKLGKFGKSLKGAEKAEYIDDMRDLQYWLKEQPNQANVNKIFNKLNNPKNYGIKGGLINSVDDVASGTISQTGSKPFMHKTTGTKTIKTPPKVKNTKTGKMEYDLNITDAKGNVTAKRFKSPDGTWYEVPNPSTIKGSSNPIKNIGDRLKWEVMENSVPDAQFNNWKATGTPYKGWSAKTFWRNLTGGSGSGPTSGASTALKIGGGVTGAGVAGKVIHDKLNQGNLKGNVSGGKRLDPSKPIASKTSKDDLTKGNVSGGKRLDPSKPIASKTSKDDLTKDSLKSFQGKKVDMSKYYDFPVTQKPIASKSSKNDLVKDSIKSLQGKKVDMSKYYDFPVKGSGTPSKGKSSKRLDTKPSKGKGYKKYVKNSYNPEGIVLTESRKTEILKNLKNPVVIPETKQKSYKVKPKIRGLNSAIISKPVETPKEYQPKGGRNLWGQFEYDRNVRQSQERKNEVLELVGEGEHAFNYMLTDSRAMNAKQLEKFWGLHPELYSYFYNGKKFKATRKEALDGDFLVFLVDENGVKSNILQSELNEKLAEEDDRKALEEYNKLNPKSKEPISFEKDYLFKKAYQKLKKEVDYKDKPAKIGYPNDPPPKMVNDRHPDFGKRPGTTAYNKLDPQSAAAMPKQDDPTIDAKVEKAKNNPDKDGSNWRKELEIKIKKHRQSIK